MNRRIFLFGMGSILLAAIFTIPVCADVLTIPNIQTQPGNADEGVLLPARGMTMDEVSAQFGTPKETKGPVGTPPITRWIYDNFTVHFEQSYVIHTVIHRDNKN